MEIRPTVLITGGAQRIGKALALDFVRNGFNICVHYHNSESEAIFLKSEIESLGGKAYLIQADLSKEEDIQTIFPKVYKQAENISVLINNASTFVYDSAVSASRESWDYHLEPNLRAPFVLSQHFAKQTKKGLILNIIDQRVLNLTPHYVTYTLSKYGLWGLTQALSLSLAPHIRVNAIGPGPTLKNSRQTEDQFAQQCKNTPLQTGGSMDDICAAAQFFVNAKTVTGQIIAVDGGQHLGWALPQNIGIRED